MADIKKLKERLTGDEALTGALKAAKTVEEFLQTLHEAGFDVTEEEVKALAAESGTPISDNDLEHVAGGWWIFW